MKKANEVPEKIYIDKDDERWYLTNPNGDSVEYIHKDAFIENALAFIRSCTTYDGLGYKSKCVNIDEFRNYMKRE